MTEGGVGSREMAEVSRQGDWVDVFKVPEIDLSVGFIEGGQVAPLRWPYGRTSPDRAPKDC